MCKYITLLPETVDETTGKALGIELQRENIWNCLLAPSHKPYKGIKFRVDKPHQVMLVNDLIIMIKEKQKTLKQDQTLINS